MSQNDYVIANQTTPLFRADLNLALQALASTSSGSAAPSVTYANMMWYDTASNILKMRSEADDAWINLGTLDQSLNTFTPAGVTGISTDSDLAGVDPTLLTTRGTIATAIAAIPAPSAPTTSQVLTATAGASVGEIGTYALLKSVGYGDESPGETAAGSGLRYATAAGTITSPTPSGTWRCMGFVDISGANPDDTTVFLRIA